MDIELEGERERKYWEISNMTISTINRIILDYLFPAFMCAAHNNQIVKA